MLLQVILEGLGLGVLLILVCAVGICKGAVDGASLQPGGAAAVRKTGAYKPGTHPTQQPAVQSSLHSRLYRLCAGLCLWDKRCKGLCSGFWQVLVILSVMNLMDRLLVDSYWVGHTNAWTIPGTEDLKPYITAKDKQKKWLFGTVGMAAIAMVLAAIMTVFTH